MKNESTKVNEVLAGGITFKARPYSPGGASVNAQQRYERTVANAARGLKDLQDIGRMILRRLDIEAAERGENAQFLCATYRTELREALRGCDGLEPAPRGYFERPPPPSVLSQRATALDAAVEGVAREIGGGG